MVTLGFRSVCLRFRFQVVSLPNPMTEREGNLQAPTRHALDWRNPAFYDDALLEAELERVFDICHGCRRCVSLCQSFPTLFDLVDNSTTMEVDGVAKEDYAKVVDQCYLCDLCYMTKCPYVPPHPWNVDFPHLMLRAKAVEFKKGKSTFRDRMLTSTDRVGRLATIPVVVQMVNKANATPSMRKVDGQACWAWRPRRSLPPYDGARFRETAKSSIAWPVRDGARTPGKVAIFATCYVNYNEPGIGHDLLAILAHNEVPYSIVEKEACCGMPKLELGDLDSVAALKDINIPPLAALARDGPRDPDRRSLVHADVQARAAAHLPRRSRREGRRRRDVRSVRVPGAARQGRAAAAGTSRRRSARSAITCRATRACRMSARRRARCWSGFPGPR